MEKKEKAEDYFEKDELIINTVILNAIEGFADDRDFSRVQINGSVISLNYNRANTKYRHTFKWTPNRHEEVISGVLTVKMRKNFHRQEVMNDEIYIVTQGGVTVGDYSQRVYVDSVDVRMKSTLSHDGDVSTKVWQLDAAVLENLNKKDHHRLSIYVCDDTRVESAYLSLTVKHSPH